MSTRGNIESVRESLAPVNETEKALERFEADIPIRRDALIRRVEAARDEVVNLVAKPASDPEP